MAFTTTSQTYEQRKVRLERVQKYLDQLNAVNEAACRLELDMIAAGETAAETVNSVNKVLAAAGPPFVTAATDLAACTGDTISDRVVNLLSSLAGMGWELTTPT